MGKHKKKHIAKKKDFKNDQEGCKKYIRQQLFNITECLESLPVNIHRLRAIAFEKDGFINKEMRRKIWPKLLGIDVFTHPSFHSFQHENEQDNQIQRDIDRSMWHYTNLQVITEEERTKKRKALFGVIKAVLNRNQDLIDGDAKLHYYQGYHDLCTVFLLVQGEFEGSLPVTERASLSYHREAMRSNFDSVMEVLKMVYPLLKTQDMELYQFIMESEVAPFFALPWVITWFAHHIDSFDKVMRLFDVFLCSHPLFSIYMSTALVLMNRNLVLQSECDFGTVHQLLSKLPETIQVEELIEQTSILFKKVPPHKLIFMAKLYSCKYMEYPFDYQKKMQIPDRILYDKSKNKKLRARDEYQLKQSHKTKLKAEDLRSLYFIIVAGTVGALAFSVNIWLKS